MSFIVMVSVILLFTLILAVSRVITGLYARGRVFSLEDVPQKRVAIVFGAGLWRNGTATPILYDRVATAVDLYLAGKVEKLLMSGDNRFVDYNEPAVMREVAISLGVPDEDIVLDFAGRRTYDTCYRAKVIFGVDQAILVTQAFHLPRALYVCNHLGVEAVGLEADKRIYRKSSMIIWNVREFLATTNAIWELFVSHPLPVLGEPEPIYK